MCADCPRPIGTRRTRCESCATRRERERRRAYYERTAETQKQARRERYAANREAELTYARFVNYGLVDEQVRAMLAEQGDTCPVCAQALAYEDVNVDHDHATGAVRGLLHGPCNRGLGSFRDDPETCERAAAYLRATAVTLRVIR